MSSDEFYIRAAGPSELPEIMRIYGIAQDRMAEGGNPDQWGKIYPTEAIIKEDIEAQRCMLVCRDVPYGVFALCEGPDPTYKVIDGAWLNDSPYAVLHRVAGDTAVRGIFGCIIKYCKEKYDNIRIDTHEKNSVMQHLVEKHGFVRCGIIITHNGTPRIAYQWMKPSTQTSDMYHSSAAGNAQTESGLQEPINTTLCYIEKDGKWLLLFRNSKPHDVNEGKWVGVGGKFVAGETSDECLLREVYEETGIRLKDYRFLGVVQFRPDNWPDEDMYLYRASVRDEDCPEGLTEPGFCREGRFEWVPEEKIFELPMWEGDPYFMRPMLKGREKINMLLEYEGDRLIQVVDLDNHR